MSDSLQGPLTFEDLQAIWEGAVDVEYARPLLAAGEGGGLEVYTQAFTQAARLSAAVDRSFQAVYIQPWSGQSDEPASGPGYATVELTFARAGYLERPLVLLAGQTVVDEVQNDHSVSGSLPTNTGRRYVLQENVVFAPGDSGPVTALARAAKPGYGYNNPLPGSVQFVENAGTGLSNDVATLTATAGAPLGSPPFPALSYALTAYNVPDMFAPANVGQHVLFTAGANAGKTALVLRFASPDLALGKGSSVTLAAVLAFESYAVTHPFLVGGAPVTLHNGGTLVAEGVLLGVSAAAGGSKFVVQVTQGDATTATVMKQERLPPTLDGHATVDVVLASSVLVPEAPSGVPLVGGASWQVLDWVVDWQLSVTNPESPAGGVLGMLDLVGDERGLRRQFNEPDEEYRDRVWNVVDVVSPNAIKRAIYAAFGSLPWCYRETTNGLLPGFFYDRTDDPDGDFYDDDMLLWAGAITSGSFNVGDPVVYQRRVPAVTGPWLTQATGIFGGILSGTTFQFVRKEGAAVEVVAGDRILDKRTGAVFTPTASVEDDWAVIRRWHTYLSYEDMRAYFVVEVPRVNFGEFGFAYDDHPLGAYDASPSDDFYDGHPAGSPRVYQALYNQLNAIRAGGVGFDLFLSDGPCI